MPEMVTLEDGTEKEVYTKEEVEGLQKGSDKNKDRKEELSKLRTTLKLGEEDNILDVAEDLANSNFAKFKAKYKALEKDAKANGKEFDENGDLITGAVNLTSEDVNKAVQEGIKNEMSSTREEEALASFDGEEKKLVKHFLDKLQAVDNNFDENFQIAVQKAFPDSKVDNIKQSIGAGVGGSFPKKEVKDSFAKSSKGLEAMQNMAPVGMEVKIVNGVIKYVKK